MTIRRIRHGAFFAPVAELPRGRHALDRDALRAAQRERLMAAFAELVAARGLAAVSVADVVAQAGVSRTAFYASFADLSACADAGYERFIAVLVERILTAMDPGVSWPEYMEASIRAYLEALQSDIVVARTFLIEMDAAGKPARRRRYHALTQIAALLAERYARLEAEDPTVGPLPAIAPLAVVHAVRQLACDALDAEDEPDLLAILAPVVEWMTASMPGATALGPA